eukprot:8866483-Pyramimonas_sp.AAC.1
MTNMRWTPHILLFVARSVWEQHLGTVALAGHLPEMQKAPNGSRKETDHSKLSAIQVEIITERRRSKWEGRRRADD